jgi:hypothetical protein
LKGNEDMSKKMQAMRNAVGGIDLVIEQDAENPVLIHSGSIENSKMFWQKLAKMSRKVLAEINTEINS